MIILEQDSECKIWHIDMEVKKLRWRVKRWLAMYRMRSFEVFFLLVRSWEIWQLLLMLVAWYGNEACILLENNLYYIKNHQIRVCWSTFSIQTRGEWAW